MKINSSKIGDFFQGIVTTLKGLDYQSWIVVVFMVFVLTVLMGLNAYSWTFFLPTWLAYALSGFMELGALVWKIADERKRNSTDQQKLTVFLVWLNIGLAVALLVANLIRNGLHFGQEAQTMDFTAMNSWDYFSFSLIGISVLSHVAGTILFRQFDMRIANERNLATIAAQSEFETMQHDVVLKQANARLQAKNQAYQQLASIRARYATSNIPRHEVESILKDTMLALEIEFGEDLDGDGYIGRVPPQEDPTQGRSPKRPQAPNRRPKSS